MTSEIKPVSTGSCEEGGAYGENQASFNESKHEEITLSRGDNESKYEDNTLSREDNE